MAVHDLDQFDGKLALSMMGIGLGKHIATSIERF